MGEGVRDVRYSLLMAHQAQCISDKDKIRVGNLLGHEPNKIP